MHVIELGLEVAGIALLTVLGRAVFVYCSPFRACRWCRRGGLIAGSLAGHAAGLVPMLPRRKRRCWRCKGTKLTRRLGGKLVHKIKLSVQQAWAERP